MSGMGDYFFFFLGGGGGAAQPKNENPSYLGTPE